MALPITDRFRFHVDYFQGSRVWRRDDKFGRDQTPPHDLVLPYARVIRELILIKNDEIDVGDANNLAHAPSDLLDPAIVRAVNRSYEKLRGEVSNAQAGVNIVEYRQARDMFATRGKQLLAAVYLLSRGKFASAGRALRCTFYDGRPPRRNRQKWVLGDDAKKTNKALSNLWLEWHFGLSPLIKDCQEAMKVLTDPIPKTVIKGSSEEFVRYLRTMEDPANPGTFRADYGVTRVRFRQGMNIAITNPNLGLAGQLGLVNPASLAWEIIPFSFVADWFVNVGDWLQGFSDFAGMNMDSPYHTSHLWSYSNHDERLVPFGAGVVYTGWRYGKALNMTRELGLSSPILSFRPLKLPSMSRVATSWSLITQQIVRLRR